MLWNAEDFKLLVLVPDTSCYNRNANFAFQIVMHCRPKDNIHLQGPDEVFQPLAGELCSPAACENMLHAVTAALWHLIIAIVSLITTAPLNLGPDLEGNRTCTGIETIGNTASGNQ